MSADDSTLDPAMPLMLMMRPVPSVGISGSSAWIMRSMPMVLMLTSSSQSVVRPGDLALLALDRPAGVVDQDVDGAEARLGRGGRGRHRVHVAHVGGHGQHAHAGGGVDLLGRLLQRVLAAREQDDVHALVGEPARDVLADALAGTGDERDAAFESKFHAMRPVYKTGGYVRYSHLSGSVRPATTSLRNSAARAPSITR